jgi:AmpE protein
MTLLALLLAAFAARQWPQDALSAIGAKMAQLLPRFEGGALHHGWLAWGALVVLPALLVGLIGAVLGAILWPLGWGWSAGALYLVLASAAANEPADAGDRLRHALRGLFAPVFYWLLLGPLGLALVVLHSLFARAATAGTAAAVAERVTPLLDALPAWALLLSLALVGNFEATLAAWRERAGEPVADRLAALAATSTDDAVPPLLLRAAILWLFILFLFALG